MADRIRVGIEYEIPPDSELHERGHVAVWRDTIWISDEEYGSTITATVLNKMRAGTDPKINAMKAARHAQWKRAVLTPPEEPPAEEG